MKFEEKTLNSEYIFRGRVINLKVDDVELPDGHKSKREIVEHNGGVTVAALTEDNELLFVRQFRYAYGEEILELPAGKLEKGEEPHSAALRELKEETGAECDKLISLGKMYPSPGYTDEIIYMYFARVASFGSQCLDDGEFLDVTRIKLDQAVDMVLTGEITDGKTQAAVLKVNELLKNR